MSNLYSADSFDANGNFISTRKLLDFLATDKGHIPSIDDINWDDPSLYSMPLTRDEIEALTYDIAATNCPLPELPPPPHVASMSAPPAHTPSPGPSEFCDEGMLSPTHSEVPDASGGVKESLQREANTSTWAARNQTQAIICPRTPPPQLTNA
ncbi:hypothetical protein BDR03DRAFT_1013242 [Suillus americanus]|nr:hypothetical protein BDR03DRAFT_1013242 [Suillus americanus]